jgi:ABC-2 type transport system ATP-binding protein
VTSVRRVIEVRGLRKRFKVADKRPGVAGAIRHLFRGRYTDKLAVDGIDLSVGAGEMVGYVGPNGAGKSTTVKMLTGITVPTAGEVLVNGLIPYRQRVENARRIGVVFGQRSQLWWDLPVQESLRLLGDIYQLPREVFASSIAELIELLELEPLLRTPARQLSLGQKMRCDLAAALLHQPAVLFLDEPTIGLDVAVKERIRGFIKKINAERGLTVLLTSHDLGDIEDLCQRLVMIDKGRIVFDGPLVQIRDRFGGARVVHLVFRESRPDAAQTARDLLATTMSVEVDQADPYQISVRFDSTSTTAGAVAGRLMAGLPVHDLRIDEPGIESIIRQLYDGTLAFDTRPRA